MYPVDVGCKLAGEDEAVNALLEARDVHDLQEVALHSAQLLGVTHPLVLGVLPLHHQDLTCGISSLGQFTFHVLDI